MAKDKALPAFMEPLARRPHGRLLRWLAGRDPAQHGVGVRCLSSRAEDRGDQLDQGDRKNGVARAGLFRARQLVRRCGLRGSRVPKEDAANVETGCGFGGVPAAGTGGEDAMTIEVFESVWDALEDTSTEAENMKLRSRLMIAISEDVAGWRVTQTEAAR